MAERGRFAPTPSGRMHLGNVFSALLAWLSVRAADGELLLRIEDLDAERCPRKYADALSFCLSRNSQGRSALARSYVGSRAAVPEYAQRLL